MAITPDSRITRTIPVVHDQQHVDGGTPAADGEREQRHFSRARPLPERGSDEDSKNISSDKASQNVML